MTDGKHDDVMLTAANVAAVFGVSLRTARRLLAHWRSKGLPVVTLPSRGGRPPLGISRAELARRLGHSPEDLADAESLSRDPAAEAAARDAAFATLRAQWDRDDQELLDEGRERARRNE